MLVQERTTTSDPARAIERASERASERSGSGNGNYTVDGYTLVTGTLRSFTARARARARARIVKLWAVHLESERTDCERYINQASRYTR